VPVERREYEGVTHEFFGTAAVVQKAKDAQAYAGQRLKDAFGSRPDSPRCSFWDFISLMPESTLSCG
jgi:hypothetical protein